tara:strand:- start:8525 stop:9316 length:792 start_codon:yes stop_codon:yes gene_type:complete
MNINPTISVVCPFHRNEKTIVRAAQSIFAQTVLPSEVIFINDGSPDNSLEAISDYLSIIPRICLIELISIDHSGPGHARNIGISKCSSTWVAFLDADDFWFPNKLEEVLKVIRSNPNANFVANEEFSYSPFTGLINANLSSYFNKSLPIPNQLYLRNFFSTSSCTVLNELVSRYLFDPFLSSCQDYELWLALSPEIIVEYIPIPLAIYDKSIKTSITNSFPLNRFRNLMIVLFRYSKYVSFPRFCMIISKHFVALVLSSLGRF